MYSLPIWIAQDIICYAMQGFDWYFNIFSSRVTGFCYLQVCTLHSNCMYHMYIPLNDILNYTECGCMGLHSESMQMKFLQNLSLQHCSFSTKYLLITIATFSTVCSSTCLTLTTCQPSSSSSYDCISYKCNYQMV